MSEVNLLEQDNNMAQGVPEKFWDAQTQSIRVDELLKSYLELEKKLGAPKDFSMPEDEMGRMQILRALGVPETPEGYEVSFKNELLCADSDVNCRLHAKGFTGEQVQEVYDLAADKLVPMILDIAAEFQAEREIERLVAHFGGAEAWAEVSRQLLAYGRKHFPAPVLEGMAASYDGVMALYRMMKGDNPQALNLDAGSGNAGANEKELHAMMRDAKYWRDKDPAMIAKVTEGFKKLYS